MSIALGPKKTVSGPEDRQVFQVIRRVHVDRVLKNMPLLTELGWIKGARLL